MAYEYSNQDREHDPYALPDIEVFCVTAEEARHNQDAADMTDDPYADFALAEGFYWQACQPGCLPDGDPNGPYPTYADALADARRIYDGELSDADPV